VEEAWFTGFADELARCLLDAERCADACEALLENARAHASAEIQRVVGEALVAPAAVARVLIELIDHPPRLVLAACRLCHESAAEAADRLEQVDRELDCSRAIAALRRASSSCGSLLDAAAS
jgi:hypothetical protein